MKKKLLLLMSLISLMSFAQNYDYTVYNPANSGIASYNINDIKLDGNANLWIATSDALILFNGTAFTNYTTDNAGVELGALQKIAIDGLNRKWVTTVQNGLIMYNGTTWLHYRMDNSGLPTNVINDVAVDASNNVWLATYSGLVKYNGSTWTVYNAGNSPITGSSVNSVATIGNNVYLTNEGILRKLSGTTFSIVGDQAQKIRRVIGNDMYVESYGGYLKYTNDQVVAAADFQTTCMLDCQFGGIDVDQNGKVWVGYSRECRTGGVQNLTDCQAYFPAAPGASFEYTSCLEVINSNTIWVGTYEMGLVKMTLTSEPCSAPTNLAVGTTTATTASFSWTASSPAPNGYTIMINNLPVLGGTPYYTNGTSITIDGLSPNSDYYWWLAADCGNAQSQWVSGGFFNTPVPPPCFTKMSNSDNHTLAIKADGSLWGWGENGYYQIGVGDTVDKKFPTRIGNDTDWVAVAASGFHSLAIKADGSLWAWGLNSNGELGDNTTIDRSTPTRVGTANNWAKISAAQGTSMAIKTDGTLWVWGGTLLGFGDFSNRYVPTQLGTATYKEVSTAGQHTLAIRTNNTLWAWGWNNTGSVGNGSNTTVIYTPVQIGTASWKLVEANQGVSHAIKTDGTLWVWGVNTDGRLGLGTTTNVLVPTQLGSSNIWSKMEIGLGFTTAIRTDGSLWAWGYNTQGQLGTGDSNFRPTPVRLGFANDWAHAGGGDRYAIYLKTNGDAYTAGWSPQGQMGLGPNVIHNTMVQIACPTSSLSNSDFLNTADEITAYPNPVTDVLNIDFELVVDTVAIYNLMGQEVMTAMPNAQDFKLNLSSLSSGAYMVKCVFGEQIKTFKIIKQ
ncbi:T9SS type A sorting domain-containing protein [Flavobacterium sp. CYK-55]|uniref:RCC1 domain-containing protein n=1 Tax=Flavobacterium sp. CYK-55 TaxID=2835529 RepID=UPI001BCD4578|nr:T9SS type A sorting domain-containing protein [Flavobacterium sp. CYK-55]MBS7787109.1 T9SS type A sorting domain-containing protein [Flavobacterium sp. CYK-55]